jgi:hypothetical protein
MINFKEFLTEGRDASLYHGTTYGAGIAIIQQNSIRPTTTHSNYKLKRPPKYPKEAPKDAVTGKHHPHYEDHELPGISLTRSLKFAIYWSRNLVLELNQRKLTQNYKIVPLQYWQSYNVSRSKEPFKYPNKLTTANEYEEFLLTGKSLPVLKYLVAVHISNELINDFKTTPAALILEQHKIPLIGIDT